MVPSLLSLARLPLAAAFVLAVDHAPVAIAVLILSGLTDVLDGYYARRHGQVTATGTVVDPITDKLFMLTVVGTLLFTNRLTLLELLLLGTRDIGEIPLVAWLSLSRHARRARREHPSANVPGKLATFAQFVAIFTALTWSDARAFTVYIAAFVGVLAAVSYWRRALALSAEHPVG